MLSLFLLSQAPRAKIFRRDEGEARDLAGLQEFMRSNDWAHDSVQCCTL